MDFKTKSANRECYSISNTRRLNFNYLEKRLCSCRGFAPCFVDFGGFSIIMGAGQGDAKKTGQGKKAATSAVVGFLVIFASYWIIQIIQIITGVEILNKK